MNPQTPPGPWRKTTQTLMPAEPGSPPPGQYNIYPAHPLPPGEVQMGFAALARTIAPAGRVTIDGFPGILWEDFRRRLEEALAGLDVRCHFQEAADALLPPDQVEGLI